MIIKVFSVDDNKDFLNALDDVLNKVPDTFLLTGKYSDVGTETGVKGLIEAIKTTRPDVILMDFDFSLVGRPNDYGITLVNTIGRELPEQKIVMLTDDSPFNNDQIYERVRRAFSAGAIAYLRKDEPDSWIDALKEAALSSKLQFYRHETADLDTQKGIPQAAINSMLRRLKNVASFHLTEQHLEVLQHLSRDMNEAEIAQKMGVELSVVLEYLQHLKTTFGATTFQGLVAAAMRNGLVF